MSDALDTEQCAGCAAVQICTRWNPNGSWDYRKGVSPCRPVPVFDCPPDAAKRDCTGCRVIGICKLDQEIQTRKYRSQIRIEEFPILDPKNTHQCSTPLDLGACYYCPSPPCTTTAPSHKGKPFDAVCQKTTSYRATYLPIEEMESDKTWNIPYYGAGYVRMMKKIESKIIDADAEQDARRHAYRLRSEK